MRAKSLFIDALKTIFAEMDLPWQDRIAVEAPKHAGHGDLATNAAMIMAGQAGMKPLELAEKLAARLLEVCPEIGHAEAARPGFCNVTFKSRVWTDIILEIESRQGAFGHSDQGNGEKAQVEYVSANPTGPLHVGHGRGAALGDSVARLLRAVGWQVETEYYLNDAGRQMRTLGKSIWLRLQEAAGRKVEFLEDGYKGDYIRELAAQLFQAEPDILNGPEDESVARCQQYGMEEILKGIKADLARFRCEHQQFASEAGLGARGEVRDTLQYLQDNGYSYARDGAEWLQTVRYGDDHDRVLRKSDGTLTYFASDIAYHRNKLGRAYQWLIDVWGADHHGYIPRMKAAIAELGDNPDKLSIMLVQLVNWLRDGQKISMSTRQGEFVTLATVIDEVGVDAARFLFLSRSCDSPLDFDLELAKRRTLDNPVYYVQYAHARVCALLRRAAERQMAVPGKTEGGCLDLLVEPEESALVRALSQYEDTVASAAKNLAPHYITRYLTELAGAMHGYYARQQILNPENPELSRARIALLRACGQVIKNGLFLLGVSAPESM